MHLLEFEHSAALFSHAPGNARQRVYTFAQVPPVICDARGEHSRSRRGALVLHSLPVSVAQEGYRPVNHHDPLRNDGNAGLVKEEPRRRVGPWVDEVVVVGEDEARRQVGHACHDQLARLAVGDGQRRSNPTLLAEIVQHGRLVPPEYPRV
eukprot:scaffold27096_cov62-Phaeocystis_antarctica.AAC.1